MTITDVARAAGVSVATVSKVVNGRYGVASSTAERVLEVVAQLGYETSLVASSLRRSRTNVIGILLAGFDPFATEILKGISAEAVGKGYELLAYSGAISDDNAVGWERRSLSRLGGTLIDGAIILTPTVSVPTSSVPVIAVDPHTGSGGPSTIDCDNIEGARAATRHLIELGHTRIAHVRGRTDLESALLREQGYRDALEAAGIAYDPGLVRDGGYRAAWAIDAARELLTLPDRPTAVFAANDLSAFGVMEVAHELGLRIPQDLSIVGFDDIPEAGSATPRLTTIAQPLQEMGARAVTMLIALLEGREVEAHVQLPSRLVVRRSTAPPPEPNAP
ncbi:LacI family DNA-binding transcriptional regulator [Xylanimonas ulmi]|uniref:LacI family transcriptional regulator n=1 Tax=Xylanimonas ulmi TaxID=228973 RepID=A0A4Q7M5R8_9MICO|nr:LacI family DNA-binding transcriptional regulator [Xylanibacterium ulmi]RZS62801.1 LacI family transcriptional regulator [Xylanibacterium ulmi]